MHVSESSFARITSTLPVLLSLLAACANATYGDAYPANGDSVAGATSTSDGGSAALGGDGSAVAGSFGVAGSVGTIGDTGGQDAASAGSGPLGFAGAGGSASAAAGAGSAGSPSSAGSTSSAGSNSTAGTCSAPAWVPNMVYRMGDKATKSGKEYTAAYYTMADPDQHCCGNGQDWASSIPCP